MPDLYERMKAAFKEDGMKDKDAKEKAARLYNAKRKPGQKPVTRSHGQKKGKK